MPTAWRQGDLIAPDDAVALGLIESTQRNTHRVIVISHSCDIASADSVEPRVETLIGVVVQEAAATSDADQRRRIALAEFLEAVADAAFLEPIDKCIGKLAARIALRQPTAQQRTLVARVSMLSPRLTGQQIRLGNVATIDQSGAQACGV